METWTVSKFPSNEALPKDLLRKGHILSVAEARFLSKKG